MKRAWARGYALAVVVGALAFVTFALPGVLRPLFLSLGVPDEFTARFITVPGQTYRVGRIIPALPDTASLAQLTRAALPLAILALAAAMLIGLPHYALLRRIERTEPALRGGGARTVALDLATLGFGAATIIAGMRAALGFLRVGPQLSLTIYDPQVPGQATALAWTVPCGVALTLILLERRRTRPTSPLAGQITAWLLGPLPQAILFAATILTGGRALQGLLQAAVTAPSAGADCFTFAPALILHGCPLITTSIATVGQALVPLAGLVALARATRDATDRAATATRWALFGVVALVAVALSVSDLFARDTAFGMWLPTPLGYEYGLLVAAFGAAGWVMWRGGVRVWRWRSGARSTPAA